MIRLFTALTFLIASVSSSLLARQIEKVELTDGYEISALRTVKCTQPKDQGRTGTCWSFATLSFLESEALRMGKEEHDLSEMYFVAHNYREKAETFLRYQGLHTFGEGGLAHDVIRTASKYGIMPESAFSGLKKEVKRHDHHHLFLALDSLVKRVNKHPAQFPDWKNSLDSIITAYLGEVPTTFDYKGQSFTANQFAQEVVGFNASDYIELSSFSHHPFYQQFVLEVPDNWSNGIYYNLPLNELEETIDFALDNGFSIAWDGDVSEKGFSHQSGLATLPNEQEDDLTPQDGLDAELEVTQELRQNAFNNFSTTDDHLMHLVGTYVDDSGKKFYLTKNSWGTKNTFKGYLYMSKAYIRMKTVGILLHKEAIPPAIKEKLGL